MKYRICFLFVLVFVNAGCATVTNPTNECRVSLLDGEGRVGDLINYGIGKITTVRIVKNGNGCDDVEIGFDRSDVGIKVEVR